MEKDLRPRGDILRVGMVSPYPLDNKLPGGVKDYITTVAGELKLAKGCEVVLIGPKIKDPDNNLADETLGRPMRISMNHTSYRANKSFSSKPAREMIERTNPDVLQFHEPFPGFLTTLAVLRALKKVDSPIIVDSVWHAFTAKLSPTHKALIRVGISSGIRDRILKRIEGRIAVSPPTAEFWSGINNEPQKRYEIIPNPIDTKFFSPEGPVFENWGKDGIKTILFAGRHDKRKGLMDLISAFAILVKSGRKDIRLKITGRGDETESIKKEAERLGLGSLVELLGVISKEGLAKAYRTVGRYRGVTCAPSVDGEAFNRTIAEARASGALVVATDIEGQRFAYGDEKYFGEMARPRDSENLAEKIAGQLDLSEEDYDFRRELGVLFTKDNFSVSRVADMLVLHWEELLSNSRSQLPKSGNIFVSPR